MTSHSLPAADILAMGRRTLEIEAVAVSSLLEHLDVAFVDAVSAMLACRGRVVVLSGMGKSGHIGSKIATTLASYRDARLLHASCRVQPWRPGHDYRR